MKKFIFLLLLSAFVLGGCANCRRIDLEDVKVEKLKFISTSKADVGLGLFLNNPTRGSIIVKVADGVVYAAGSEFAKVSLIEPVEFVQGEPSQAHATLRVELTDPLGALLFGLNPKSWNLEQFVFSGVLVVKKGLATKKFKFEDVPVKDIAGKFNLQL